MKHLFKAIFCCSLLMIPTLALGQQAQTYLQRADDYFVQGDYNRAMRNYIVAQMEGLDVGSKLQNAELCLSYRDSGDEAYRAQNYAEAKSLFSKILQMNPSDPNVPKRIEACDKMMLSVEPVQIVEPQNQAPIITQRESRFLSQGHNNYLAWGIIDAGYPWKLGTSFMSRHGNTFGMGYYLNIGVDWGGKSTYDSEKSINMFHYEIGLKCFPYKNLFVSTGYGTLGCHKMSRYNDDDGRWNTEGWRQGKGIPVLVGYDTITGDLSLRSRAIFSFGAGLSYDTFTKKWEPAINIKIGVAWRVK